MCIREETLFPYKLNVVEFQRAFIDVTKFLTSA